MTPWWSTWGAEWCGASRPPARAAFWPPISGFWPMWTSPRTPPPSPWPTARWTWSSRWSWSSTCRSRLPCCERSPASLKPGGTVILSVPSTVPRHDDHDYWRFTAQGLEKLGSRTFENGEVHVFGGHLRGPRLPGRVLHSPDLPRPAPQRSAGPTGVPDRRATGWTAEVPGHRPERPSIPWPSTCSSWARRRTAEWAVELVRREAVRAERMMQLSLYALHSTSGRE